MSTNRVLICGDLVYSHQECAATFGGIADVIIMTSKTRTGFLAGFQTGGAYAGVVGIYHRNTSAIHVGVFDAEVIDVLANAGVSWIAHNGAGYDKIDVVQCKVRGIFVSNTPDETNDSTATTALYLILACFTGHSLASRTFRETRAVPTSAVPLRSLHGLAIAIFGLGGIGLRLAELTHAMFGMRVLYHNRSPHASAPTYCAYYDKEHLGEMLRQADVLSVHLPLNEETEGMVGEEIIRVLKPGCVLVNTGRGRVVDEDALISALEDGHLSAAGLDVLPDEPRVNPRLFALDNVVLLPHVGASTYETQKAMELRAMKNLRQFLLTGRAEDVVWECR